MSRMFLILLLGLFWGCNSQPPASVFLPDAQQIRVATPVNDAEAIEPLRRPMQLYQDLGVVQTGTKHEVEFEIKNTSDVDWIFHDMIKVCRCVVAEPIPKLISKRSSAKVRMTIDSGKDTGDSDRVIRLNYTNRPGSIALNVKMRIRTPLYVSCRELRFPKSSPGQKIEAIAQVENWSDAKWDSLDVKPNVEWIQATVTPSQVPVLMHIEPGLRMQQTWNITVTANPPPEVTGSIAQTLVVRAGGTDEVLTLPVVGERPHPVVSQPPAMIVSRVSATESASRTGRKLMSTLSIPKTSLTKSFKVLTTTGMRLDGCEIKFEQVSPTEARVEVVIPPTVSGGISGFVVVKFADGLPDLAIPVAGGV